MIVLERNRRVAKAYARAPVVTVNGSEEGFDGFRIGNISCCIYLAVILTQPFLNKLKLVKEKSIKVGWQDAVRCQNLLYVETEHTASPKFPSQANNQNFPYSGVGRGGVGVHQ